VSKRKAPLMRVRASRAWCILLPMQAAQGRVSNIMLRIRISSFNYRTCSLDLSVTTRATHHGSFQREQKDDPAPLEHSKGFVPCSPCTFILSLRSLCAYTRNTLGAWRTSLAVGDGLVGRLLSHAPAPPSIGVRVLYSPSETSRAF
jgi:hypothetical protein